MPAHVHGTCTCKPLLPCTLTGMYTVHTCTLYAVYKWILSHHDKSNILSTTLSVTMHVHTTIGSHQRQYITVCMPIFTQCMLIFMYMCVHVMVSCAGDSVSCSTALHVCTARPATPHSNSQAMLPSLHWLMADD